MTQDFPIQNDYNKLLIETQELLETVKEMLYSIPVTSTESERLKIDKRDRKQKNNLLSAIQHLVTYALILLATLL